ncbi:hypothetical protein E4T56_gene9771 [Termitomyces sp. T112]|nr:hypothetical protein E4T56_gene9771 [Termitomyces sp. T112]
MTALIPRTLYKPDFEIPALMMTPNDALVGSETKNNLVPMVQQKPSCDWRAGAMLFMSIPLLLGEKNSVIDDVDQY